MAFGEMSNIRRRAPPEFSKVPFPRQFMPSSLSSIPAHALALGFQLIQMTWLRRQVAIVVSTSVVVVVLVVLLADFFDLFIYCWL